MLAGLVVCGLGPVAACSGSTSADEGGPAPASPSTSGTPSATPSSTPYAPATGTPHAASEPLSARAYTAALRSLAGADTATFELVVVGADGTDAGDLALLPRAHGSWRISTGESEQATTTVGDDGSVNLVLTRAVGGASYVRLTTPAAAADDGCWLEVADSGAGLPPALDLLDGYRPAGRPDAGTVDLAVVLGALGFQNVVNAHPGPLRGLRVPVQLQLDDGAISRAYVFPDDVTAALDGLGSRSPALAALARLVARPASYVWGIQYSAVGEPVRVDAPPADQVVTAGSGTCAG